MPAEAPPAPAPAVAPQASLAPSQSAIAEAPRIEVPSPTDPPKTGSAKERMRQASDKKWNDSPATTADAPRPGATDKTPTPTKTDDKPEFKPGDKPPEATTEDAPADIPADKKKQNPWKLWRESEKRATQLASELSEVKNKGFSEAQQTELQQKIESAEAKIKTYEDELRFKAYEKSPDFHDKYEVPYDKAWEKHMRDLRGVTVAGDNGIARPMAAGDILDLVNLELPDARKLAVEKFGDFAQDAMAARKEIRDLFEAKQTALEEAKKTGADREKAEQSKRTTWLQKTQKLIKDTWATANQRAVENTTNGEFFKPIEGDDIRNSTLDKGYKQVDAAFALNPWDAKLTDDERRKAVEKHAIIRNRSAAYGVLKLVNQRLKAERDAFQKELGEIKKSTPPTGGGAPASSGAAMAGGKARDRMHAAGDKYAK